jgi:hypothetical protein
VGDFREVTAADHDRPSTALAGREGQKKTAPGSTAAAETHRATATGAADASQLATREMQHEGPIGEAAHRPNVSASMRVRRRHGQSYRRRSRWPVGAQE